jgi:hypothetical protein
MAGGTVTISGGNVIHTFTSSGYLTPLKLVNNSLRFRSSASAYLSRTPLTAATSTTKGTISLWFKGLGQTSQYLVGKSSGTIFYLYFNSSSQLVWQNGGVNTRITTQVFRDPAAWYHLVVSWDTTQANSSNRQAIYLNGQQITAFGTTNDLGSSATVSWFDNDGNARGIGSYTSGGYFDGYMTEINCIDGQALTPNSFGTFNSYGVWQPINYGGSYGTNGFYLPFTNKTSTTTLGYDFSPAGNNWTTNNISLTAGVTYDSMTDVPTLTSATAANYCVINPLTPAHGTISNGNLTVASAGNNYFAPATVYVNSGKWYAEYTLGSGGNAVVGIIPSTTNLTSSSYFANGAGEGTGLNDTSAGSGAFRIFNYDNAGSTQSLTGQTYASGDVLGIAMDLDNGILNFYRNGTILTTGRSNNNAVSYTLSSVSAYWAFASGNNATYSINMNFGQQPFAYTPPTNFVALNTYNL